jgi:hypothetical protein
MFCREEINFHLGKGLRNMEGEQEKILMYSRYVDEKLIEWYRTKNAAVKKELRKAQENLDQLVLGRKLKQDEIDQLIKDMEG